MTSGFLKRWTNIRRLAPLLIYCCAFVLKHVTELWGEKQTEGPLFVFLALHSANSEKDAPVQMTAESAGIKITHTQKSSSFNFDVTQAEVVKSVFLDTDN